MADNLSAREKKTAVENRRRTINYIAVAALAALVVTVLFLAFGRTDKGASDSKVNAGTGTEQVNTPGTSQPSGTVTRPASTTVTRPSTSTTYTRPSTSTTVTRPASTTVTRPSTSTTYTRPSSSDTETAPSGSGRVDYPQRTKWDVINKSDSASSRDHRRGGTRRR